MLKRKRKVVETSSSPTKRKKTEDVQDETVLPSASTENVQDVVGFKESSSSDSEAEVQKEQIKEVTVASSDDDMGGFQEVGQQVEGEDSDEDELHPFEVEAMEETALETKLREKEKQELVEEVKKADKFQLPTQEQLDKERGQPVDLSTLKGRIQDVLEVLGNFKALRVPDRSRPEYIACLKDSLMVVYGYNQDLTDLLVDLFGPHQCLAFFEANEKHRPTVIRVNTLKARRRDVMKSLKARAISLEPLAKWTKVGIKIIQAGVPLGATPEYMAGQYMLQSPSSFLPVMALGVKTKERILDMASAPGGKTTHIAMHLKNTGSLVAIDLSRRRLKAVAANCHRMGVANAVIAHMDGRDVIKHFQKFDRVLLDAPCTCVGVIARDSSIRSSKKMEQVLNSSRLQRELIRTAIDVLKDNGTLVYSTCSVLTEENEDVIAYALRTRFVKVVDAGLPFGIPGFTHFRHKHYHPSMKLTRRYYPHVHNMDGFFVAKLVKIKRGVKKPKFTDEDKAEAEVTTNESEEKASKKMESKTQKQTSEAKTPKKKGLKAKVRTRDRKNPSKKKGEVYKRTKEKKVSKSKKSLMLTASKQK